MVSTDLNFADIDEFVQLLKVAGVKNVTTEPGELNTPGVLVEFAGFDYDALATGTMRLRVHLVSADVKRRQVMTNLQGLLDQVVPVLRALGGPEEATAVLLTLPGRPPVPALSIPFDLLTTQE